MRPGISEIEHTCKWSFSILSLCTIHLEVRGYRYTAVRGAAAWWARSAAKRLLVRAYIFDLESRQFSNKCLGLRWKQSLLWSVSYYTMWIVVTQLHMATLGCRNYLRPLAGGGKSLSARKWALSYLCNIILTFFPFRSSRAAQWSSSGRVFEILHGQKRH